MARMVPKLSGLIRTGSVVPAAPGSTDGLPDLPSAVATARSTDLALPSPARPEVVGNVTREIRILPLSKLRIHPFNSRVHRPQERIEEVKGMLTAENIQREPITVVPGRRPDDAGIYYILSGQTRFHSANLAGWTELKTQINPDIDPDDHLAFWRASLEHNTSIRETDWDVAVQAKRLLDEGADQEQIMKAARRDARGLRRLLAMVELPEAVQSVVRDNPIKLTAPFCEILKSGIAGLGENAIAELAKTVVQEDMAQRTLSDKIEREVRRTAKAKDSGTKRATREFLLPVNVAGHEKKAGDFKVLLSRKPGNRVVTLTADLPERYAEILKADIAASIAKFSGEASEA